MTSKGRWQLGNLTVIPDPGYCFATGIKEADNRTEIYGFHCSECCLSLPCVPSTAPDREHPITGCGGAQQNSTDSLRMALRGPTHREGPSPAPPCSLGMRADTLAWHQA